MAPIKLIGFTRRKTQWHIGGGRRGASLLAQTSGVARTAS
jgi:hypothetical protein